jgi:hypothetical protein
MTLPKRQSYAVESLDLDVQATPSDAAAVMRAVSLPEPPAEPLTERDLIGYIKDLRLYALAASSVLAEREQSRADEPPQARITITVTNRQHRTIGTIRGDGSAYGPRGSRLT